MVGLRFGAALLLALVCLLTEFRAVPERAAAADLFFSPFPTRPGVSVHLPPKRDDAAAAQVLVLLHGMDGSGQTTAAPWLEEADKRGWVVVAPTFNYGNWYDPAQVRADDIQFTTELASILAELPQRIDRPVASRALLFGFSRGAQLAHRYALYYPQRVRGVAAFSAGTYTLPDTQLWINGKPTPLPLPFGVADMDRWIGHPCNQRALTQVPFWVGVGANDNREADVPREWDAYIGKNRVVRATSFQRALERYGVPTELTIFPNTDHFLTPAVIARALAFFDHAAGNTSAALHPPVLFTDSSLLIQAASVP